MEGLACSELEACRNSARGTVEFGSCFEQVKSEIHCEFIRGSRRVSKSVGLDCRQRLQIEPGSPPFREGDERLWMYLSVRALAQHAEGLRSVPSTTARRRDSVCAGQIRAGFKRKNDH